MKMTLKELRETIVSAIKEDSTLNIMDTNKKITFDYMEAMQMMQNLQKVRNYMISLENIVENKPDLHDKTNRARKIIKSFEKKLM